MVRRWILLGLSLGFLVLTVPACGESKPEKPPQSGPIPKAEPVDVPSKGGGKAG